MAHNDIQTLTTLGFTLLFVLAAVISFRAYSSVQRMDGVVLRARMYMNRERLFAGLRWVPAGRVVIMAVAAIATVSQVLHATMPSAVGSGGLFVSFAFLTYGLYNFYALSRPPKASAPSEAPAPSEGGRS